MNITDFFLKWTENRSVELFKVEQRHKYFEEKKKKYSLSDSGINTICSKMHAIMETDGKESENEEKYIEDMVNIFQIWWKTLNLQTEKYQQSPAGKKKNKAFVSESKSKKKVETEREPMLQYIKRNFW